MSNQAEDPEVTMARLAKSLDLGWAFVNRVEARLPGWLDKLSPEEQKAITHAFSDLLQDGVITSG